MKIPFLAQEVIRKHVYEVLREYERVRRKAVTFPLDAADVFEKLFGLTTLYDTNGVINHRIGQGIIGCLFPDGHASPWGLDRLIVVNATRSPSFDPTRYNENFTVAHEGVGHFILHYLKGITGEKQDRPEYCRTHDYPPLAWQANFAAAQLTQPLEQVVWLLNGKKPPEAIVLDLYEHNYREYFGASRSMMEVRLKTLGYQLCRASSRV
jgi:hypothetical protein